MDIVRTKGYSTVLLDPTQVESKKSSQIQWPVPSIRMLNLWIFSLEKNKSETLANNLTIYYKLIKRQSNKNTIK